MALTGCMQEEAERVLRECNNDTVDAVDKILKIPESRWTPKRKRQDETQQKFSEIRKEMEAMDRLHDAKLMKTSQPDCSSSQELSHTLVRPQEELWSDSHRTPQNQIVIPELMEQTQGIAYQ
jgi:hypothetical protein